MAHISQFTRCFWQHSYKPFIGQIFRYSMNISRKPQTNSTLRNVEKWWNKKYWNKTITNRVFYTTNTRMCFLPRTKAMITSSVKVKLSCFLAVTVTGSALYWTKWCDFSDVSPACWIRAQCQGEVVIKPLKTPESKQSETLHDWISKLVHNVHYSVLLCIQGVRVCLMFVPLLCVYPLTLLSGKLYTAWLMLLFYMVQRCGPMYIKLGQWASTRRDLFSAEFCQLFSRLHSRVKSHEWHHTEHVLVTAYGKRWRDMIKIDKSQQPLGSGCVAQVYKGYVHVGHIPPETVDALEDSDTDTLADIYFRDGVEIQSLPENVSLSGGGDSETEEDSGDGSALSYADNPEYIAVAVKVLHPGIVGQFHRDLRLMKVMASVMETVIPSLHWLNLKECVREFSLSMLKQMDMKHEARCLKRFHADFADVPFIKIPVPIMSLVRRNILVESFEEGEPISDFITDNKDTPAGLREKLAEMGIDALLQMVFVKNFVHGDLHPGNILVQNTTLFTEEPEDSLVMVDLGDVVMATVSPNECPLRLVLLDCGITASLGTEDRLKFNQVFTAVVKGEGEVVADLFLEKSHHMECTDPEAFRRDMAVLVHSARQTTLQLSKIKVSDLLSDVFTLLSRHRIKLESNFATVILAIGVLEGLGRSLDPDLDLLAKATTVLLGPGT